MNFNWEMTKKDWEAYKNTVHTRDINKVDDWYGRVTVGAICCDFQHTMDTSAWYAFSNIFYKDENASYGETENGIHYNLHNDSPAIPMKCRSFESFKKKYEKLLEDYINQYEELKVLIDEPMIW